MPADRVESSQGKQSGVQCLTSSDATTAGKSGSNSAKSPTVTMRRPESQEDPDGAMSRRNHRPSECTRQNARRRRVRILYQMALSEPDPVDRSPPSDTGPYLYSMKAKTAMLSVRDRAIRLLTKDVFSFDKRPFYRTCRLSPSAGG